MAKKNNVKVFGRYLKQKEELSKKIQVTASGKPYIHLDPTDNDIVGRSYYMLSDKSITQTLMNNQLTQIKSNAQSMVNKQLNQFNVQNSEFQDVMDFIDSFKAETQKAITEGTLKHEIKTAGKKLNIKKSIFDKNVQQNIIKDVEASAMKLTSFNKDSKEVRNTDLFQKIDGKLSNLQELIDFYDEMLKDTKLRFNDKKIEEMVDSFIATNLGKKTSKGDAIGGTVFGEAYDEFLKENKGKIIAMDGGGFRKAEKTFEAFAARLKTYRTLMKKLQTDLEKSRTSERAWKQRLAQGVASSSGVVLSQVGGFLYESVVDGIIDSAKGALLDSIRTVKNTATKQVELSPELQRAMIDKHGESMTTTMSKEDVGVTYKLNTITGNGEASVYLRMPGISVKAFSPSGEKYQSVHIRSNVTVNEIFGLTVATNKNMEYRYLIGNILSYKGKAGLPSRLKGDAYDFLALNHAMYALSGTQQKGDLAMLLVLNKKVFTIPDIMEKIIKNQAWIKASSTAGFTAAQALNVQVDTKEGETTEQAADRRSDAVYDKFLEARMNIELKMFASALV